MLHLTATLAGVSTGGVAAGRVSLVAGLSAGGVAPGGVSLLAVKLLAGSLRWRAPPPLPFHRLGRRIAGGAAGKRRCGGVLLVLLLTDAGVVGVVAAGVPATPFPRPSPPPQRLSLQTGTSAKAGDEKGPRRGKGRRRGRWQGLQVLLAQLSRMALVGAYVAAGAGRWRLAAGSTADPSARRLAGPSAGDAQERNWRRGRYGWGRGTSGPRAFMLAIAAVAAVLTVATLATVTLTGARRATRVTAVVEGGPIGKKNRSFST
ncbi:unnamed protein product [Closterium sp. NIES-64]|nr:unnamed protein product [Closterium sp. NIES-64]